MCQGDDGLPVDGHRPAFGLQARAAAVRAGLGDDEFVQVIAVAGFVHMRMEVLGVAAQQVGGHALEAPLAHGGRRCDLWEVAAEEGAIHAVEQQVALHLRIATDWQREVEGETVVVCGGLQDGAVIVDVELDSNPTTAPSARLFSSSTRRFRSACWTLPSPVQVGQAPSGLLKEKCAMLSVGTGAPQLRAGKASLQGWFLQQC